MKKLATTALAAILLTGCATQTTTTNTACADYIQAANNYVTTSGKIFGTASDSLEHATEAIHAAANKDATELTRLATKIGENTDTLTTHHTELTKALTTMERTRTQCESSTK